MIARIKAWLKERRIRRFKARFAEAYPDAAEFLSRVSWLDGSEDFIFNGGLHVTEQLSSYERLSDKDLREIQASVDNMFNNN